MSATRTRSTGATRLGDARRLTTWLVKLIEQQGLSVAAAARTLGVDVERAGMLVRLYAIESEAAESELEERLEDIQALCPGEDWFSYSDRQLEAIASGRAIPSRVIRQLVCEWCERNSASAIELAAKAGIDPQRLRRAVGLTITPRRADGRGAHRQMTISVECASRIVKGLGIPPCEVPGL